jgi:hypothetical protein
MKHLGSFVHCKHIGSVCSNTLSSSMNIAATLFLISSCLASLFAKSEPPPVFKGIIQTEDVEKNEQDDSLVF